MKYKLTLLFLLFSATLILAKPIKVACVGNSITYGYTFEQRVGIKISISTAKNAG